MNPTGSGDRVGGGKDFCGQMVDLESDFGGWGING